MRLTEIHLLRYTIPLVRPLNMMGYVIDVREGVVLKILDDAGNFGLADLCPFPGLNRESLNQAIGNLKILAPSLANIDHQLKIPQSQVLDGVFASVRFALEWSLLDLQANRKQIQTARLLNPGFCTKLMVNRLLTGPPDRIREEIAKSEGIQPGETIKIKVGRREIDEEIDLICWLDKHLPRTVKLRLDANQNWTLTEALYFARHIPRERIEYIEEPLINPFELGTFYNACQLPFAYDETLHESPQADFVPGLKAVIIKPGVIGSLNKLRHLSDFAAQHELLYVVSSAFESGVGLRILCQLAAAFGTAGTAIGLDTYKWFAEDITLPVFNAAQNKIAIDFCSTMNFSLRDESFEKEVIRI